MFPSIRIVIKIDSKFIFLLQDKLSETLLVPFISLINLDSLFLAVIIYYHFSCIFLKLALKGIHFGIFSNGNPIHNEFSVLQVLTLSTNCCCYYYYYDFVASIMSVKFTAFFHNQQVIVSTIIYHQLLLLLLRLLSHTPS